MSDINEKHTSTEPTDPAPASTPAPGTSQPKDPIELFPENPPAAENAAAEEIKQATAGLFARFKFSKGRGRPRKDGLPGKLDGALEGGAVAAVPVDRAELDRARDQNFVRKCLSKISKALFRSFDQLLESKAVAVTKDRQFAKELVASTTPNKEELDDIADVLDECLSYMKVDKKYVPLVAGIAVISGIGIRYAGAFRELNLRQSENAGQPQKV
jgi:hypothetical protein